jgi:hypothetical protein
MASYLRNHHDTITCPHNDSSRWTKEGCDDWKGVPESNRTHWVVLQFELDLRKFDIPVLERFVHPND